MSLAPLPDGRARVTVHVRKVRDVPVRYLSKSIYARTWLDTSLPPSRQEAGAVATDLVRFTRKSRGPKAFVEETGESNVLPLPAYVVVCDVYKTSSGCCALGGEALIGSVRIPLASAKLDESGRSEMWYSFHYPHGSGQPKAGQFAGKLLIGLQVDGAMTTATTTTPAADWPRCLSNGARTPQSCPPWPPSFQPTSPPDDPPETDRNGEPRSWRRRRTDPAVARLPDALRQLDP